MLNTKEDLMEKFKNKRVFVITHNDLDGVGSHIVARQYLQPICKEFNYYVAGNDDSEPVRECVDKLGDVDYFIFADIAPTVEFYDYLISIAKEDVFIFDHHISSYYNIGERDNYFFDLDRCGARIFFEELTRFSRVKKIFKQFIELVDTYDRWQQDSLLWRNAKDLSNVMYGTVNWFDKKLDDNTRYIPFVNRMLDKFLYAKTFYLTPTEQSYADDGDRKEQKALSIAKKSLHVRVDNDRNNYIWFACPSKISFVASFLLKEYRDKVEYCVCNSTFSPKDKKISLRSQESFDVSVIAEKFGGGGHKNAAGFSLADNIEFYNKLKSGEEHLI